MQMRAPSIGRRGAARAAGLGDGGRLLKKPVKERTVTGSWSLRGRGGAAEGEDKCNREHAGCQGTGHERSRRRRQGVAVEGWPRALKLWGGCHRAARRESRAARGLGAIDEDRLQLWERSPWAVAGQRHSLFEEPRGRRVCHRRGNSLLEGAGPHCSQAKGREPSGTEHKK
ncbi:hypothetical protein GOP47_0002231 [Adiantum capillus-veneris]|uniref:Uncharacterized protein n=1 Tax=Adiantum capillus-veneris TaxID=13818 RepID=A0A9D4VBC6_ADICA|nr:hypothetical protein GOP47_0002231 [Adiantum capillus-veneris]